MSKYPDYRGLYSIYRMYQDDRPRRRMAKDMSLAQAQAWCEDPETSSMTAKPPKGCGGNEKTIARWHEKQKHWFDGYEQQ